MIMEWKPFGRSMTYEDFQELLEWYILKYSIDNLNTTEVTNNAIKLHP